MEDEDSPPSPPPLRKTRGRPRKQEVADMEESPEPQEPVRVKRKRKLPENSQPRDVSFQSKRGTVQFTALKRLPPS